MESHHTEAQIKKAFQKAPKILKQLKEAGVKFPKFELYEDASGALILGTEKDNITNKQYELASKLVRSNRPYLMLCSECMKGDEEHEHVIGLRFCCGLVDHSSDS